MTRSPTVIVPEHRFIKLIDPRRRSHHSTRSQKHGRRQRAGEYDVLARIEVCQGSRDLDGRFLVLLQIRVVLRDLKLSVIEILQSGIAIET